ncbi:MAG: glycogen/starch/alpha-glucan phosphorylase [Candidatus Krumholzibacteriota bacterium]|nr:glycogen/starch/alpha-glucan phosphorylase [Candidatus Krumholzibacteriota bacterium]
MRQSELFRKWGIFHKGMDRESIAMGFANHLEYSLSKDQYTATVRDLYHALALTARDRLIEQWIRTQQHYYDVDAKRVYYLSAEYLLGRALVDNLVNLNIYAETREAMATLNLDIDELAGQEPDAGLGNGGLGRLAACFLDSMAALELPSYGYGIRYEFGIFDQAIRDLGQVELPDCWLKYGNPWEIERPEYSFTVKFHGRTRDTTWPDGSQRTLWVDTRDVLGVAHDTPIAGYDNTTVNTLRLWASRASKEFDLEYFQNGDYLKAVEEKNLSENISKVLYPSDTNDQGRELRLKQQYFFVSCSIQDIVRRYLVNHDTFDVFPEKVAIQMNDTHPSLAVVELMRLLVDEQHLPWEQAWDITTRSCAYTNHTILAEALEEWPVQIFGSLLPRHLQIVYEINRRFLRDVSIAHPGDDDRARRMSIVREDAGRKIRMSHLAIVGSHAVNGVARLHTGLLREGIFRDFDDFFPGRIRNVTNGITPRRWLLAANPALAGLVSGAIGTDWVRNLDELRRLEAYADDAGFRSRFAAVKKQNKSALADLAEDLTGYLVDPDTIFDVQVKRIHEYKRQLLNILHVIYLWVRLKEEPEFRLHPRTFVFAGKAAPDYEAAKLIIRLICHTAEMINTDPVTRETLRVVFLPNYRVTLAERIIPAADVSEQISTAGYEASGTGNMKLALNGALTVGTLDGATVEIAGEVGRENLFLFGLEANEVAALRPVYDPREYARRDPALEEAIGLVDRGFFSPDQPGLFRPLVERLLNEDPYLVLADFADYHRCQMDVDRIYRDRDEWLRRAILNVARMGRFSSDRSIADYNRKIWRAEPVSIPPERIRPLGEADKIFGGTPGRGTAGKATG